MVLYGWSLQKFCLILLQILLAYSIRISICKILQNTKNTLFYRFWPKKTHIYGCKIVHKCTIATVTVHICTVTVVFAFNIFFSLSTSLYPFLSSLTITSLSFLPLISAALSSLTTTMSLPISSLVAAHADRCCLTHHSGFLSFPTVTTTQQRRRRQISNHQLSTTQPSPPQPKPTEKLIPNPNQNQ